MADVNADRPSFSVVIPTYGRPRYLKEAVASVMAQTIADLECIVVDDASPEPVELDDEPRLRVIHRPENGGPAAARNSGLTAARGEFIAFLDDDDLYAPDRLAIAAEGLANAPLAICWTRTMGSEDGGGGRLLAGDVRDTILDATTPHLGATAVRRDVARPFDERFLATEDVEWWLRMSTLASVSTVPRVGLLYRRHAGARHESGTPARVRGSLDLMELERAYFGTHPRAAAFRWMRIGLMAMDEGDMHLARRAFWRSWRAHATVRSVWHLAQASTRRSAIDPSASEQEAVALP